VISFTVSSHEKQYIQYTRMSFPIYQHVVNLVVSLLIRRRPGVFMNISVREHRVLNK